MYSSSRIVKNKTPIIFQVMAVLLILSKNFLMH